MDDVLADFHPRNGHLRICNVNGLGCSPRCNRDCALRLMGVALRLNQMLNPAPAWPECDHHVEVTHRDGKPPWCNTCGWCRGHGVVTPAKHGVALRDQPHYGEHLPWTPEQGYDLPDPERFVSGNE